MSQVSAVRKAAGSARLRLQAFSSRSRKSLSMRSRFSCHCPRVPRGHGAVGSIMEMNTARDRAGLSIFTRFVTGPCRAPGPSRKQSRLFLRVLRKQLPAGVMNALLIIPSLSHPFLVRNYFNSRGHSGKKWFHSVMINSTEGFHAWFVLGGRLRCPGQMMRGAEGGDPAAELSPQNVFVFSAHQLCHHSVWHGHLRVAFGTV